MSRSYKKQPGFGWSTAESDDEYKKQEARRFRRTFKQHIMDDENDAYIDSRLYGSPNKSPKDGKQWWHNAQKKDMRK